MFGKIVPVDSVSVLLRIFHPDGINTKVILLGSLDKFSLL